MELREYEAAAVAAPPTKPVTPSVGFPTNGNPQGGQAATTPGEYWFHQVSEELRQVIIDAGLTPDSTKLNQLSLAIQAMIPTATVPQGYLVGLGTSNNAVDALHDIDIAPGIARSADNTQDLVLSATLTKQLDVVWAPGTNKGGLFAGAIAANTTYHLFLIRKVADGSIDAYFDTSLTANNIPAGWGAYRRVMSVMTGSASTILPYLQDGDTVQWQNPVLDVSISTFSSTATNFTVTVPAGISVLADLTMNIFKASAEISSQIWSPDVNPPTARQLWDALSTGGRAGQRVMVRTNTASQVRAAANGTGITLNLETHGYIDSIRRAG